MNFYDVLFARKLSGGGGGGGGETLYKLPDVPPTTITVSGRTATIEIKDGLIMFTGNTYNTIYVDKEGNVSDTPPTTTWFNLSTGQHVKVEAYDMMWMTGTGNNQSIDPKWSRSDGGGNVVTASKAIASASKGLDGVGTYESLSYGADRTIGGFALQWTNNTSGGGVVCFRIKMTVDGVRYF